MIDHSITNFLKQNIAGETILFLAGKAAFWERAATLLVADLHWGKTAVFRAAGIPIPEDVLAEDLRRLGLLIRATSAQRVIVLGDLIHAQKGLTSACINMISEWRQALPVRMGVVLGNHDRGLRRIPADWSIEQLGDMACEGPFCFRHEPIPVSNHHVWAGHVHPMLKLSGGPDKLRLPCFWLRQSMTLLPSFSLFTRGANIQLSKGECALLVHDHGISAVGSNHGSNVQESLSTDNTPATLRNDEV